MNNSSKKNDDLLNRINQHPELKARFISILDLAENSEGDIIKADNAEKKVTEEVRKLGNEILHSWASERVIVSAEKFCNEEFVKKDGKKNLKWHTTYGDIEVDEFLFRKNGERCRPFSISAMVNNRECSLILQRAIVDFGADNAFGRAQNKLKEHYGINLNVSAIRNATENHGKIMHENNNFLSVPDIEGCAIQIGEIDGSMVPIVSYNENNQDKRKDKTLEWKEARLSIAHEIGSKVCKFGAVYQGDVNDAGQTLLNSAILSGFGKETHLHSVGDGATWIANQISDKFGTQGSFLIDFYHVCEYLGDAAKSCSFNDTKNWLEEQKTNLKDNNYEQVLNNLLPYLEPSEIKNEKAPVRACFRYLHNRTDQLDYKTAIKKGLPIGSGEIESAHRYIIQERLKISGAWWLGDNVDPMLALRVIRANNQWENYWEELPIAA